MDGTDVPTAHPAATGPSAAPPAASLSAAATGRTSRRRSTGPTIEDVARIAGVSRGTVSRVLNGGPVSAHARDRVHAAITESGYQANRAARSLASGRTDVLAAVISVPYGEVFDDPTFALMLQGMSTALSGTTTSLNLLIVTTDDERARAAHQLHPARVDGVILLTPRLTEPILDSISPQLPVAVCGHLGVDRDLTWSISIDDVSGGRQGAEHLVAAGCRKIAIIGGPEDSVGALRRVEGQREALGALFHEHLLLHRPYSADGGTDAMRRLLEVAPDLDGVLCGSDRQAQGAMQILAEHGRAVPSDVRIVGFDDHRIARDLSPQLTTIHQPITEVGARAAALLETHLAGEDVHSHTLPTRLVVRQSA